MYSLTSPWAFSMSPLSTSMCAFIAIALPKTMMSSFFQSSLFTIFVAWAR